MKIGEVVFFQVAKTSSARKAPAVKFQGHGFGVLLGYVPPFQKDPPPEMLLRIMGNIGFLSFDDVGEFLGAEAGTEVVKKFEDKYYGKVVDPTTQAELPLTESLPPSKLFDANGRRHE